MGERVARLEYEVSYLQDKVNRIQTEHTEDPLFEEAVRTLERANRVLWYMLHPNEEIPVITTWDFERYPPSKYEPELKQCEP